MDFHTKETNQSSLQAEREASSKISRNTIKEEDDEGLDQSYATNRINLKSERAESKKENSNQEAYYDEDGQYHNIYQDIEPDEEEDQELIDFNQQMAYESENSRESLKEEENSQEEIGFKNNNDFENYSNEGEKETEIKNISVLQETTFAITETNNPTKEQTESNTIAIKAAAAAAAEKSKLAKRPKKKDDLEYKTKKFYEDKRETKTIFSKICEDLMYKLTKDKFHKSSSYQYMTDDLYISRVVQKGDRENDSKFRGFVERNNDFYNKRKLRLNEKIKKISEEASVDVYGIPNKKVFDRAEIRNAQEFYENQKNFVLQKEQNLDVQRQEALKKSQIAEHGHIPKINEFSRSLVVNRKKTEAEKPEEVFVRLHNQKNARNKQHIFEDLEQEEKEKEAKLSGERELKAKNKAKSLQRNNLLGGFAPTLKLKGVKKPKEELQGYSSKLHDDARKKLERNEAKIHKAFAKVQADLQCKTTKIMNVKKFVESFENALNQVFAANRNQNDTNINKDNNLNKEVTDGNTRIINFSDYCNLLFTLGFTKHNYTNLECFSEKELEPAEKSNKKDLKELNRKSLNADKKPELINKQIQKEAKLLKNSWEILISTSANNKYEANEVIEFGAAEAEDVLLFLCVVQGFLKGDVRSVSAEEGNEIQQIKINKLLCELNKAEKDLITEKNESEGARNNMHHNAKSLQKALKMKRNLINVFADHKNTNAHGDQEVNRLKRVKSKDNCYLGINKHNENEYLDLNILDEEGENKYKRRKTKDKALPLNNNNNNDQGSLIKSLLNKAKTATNYLNSNNQNNKEKSYAKSPENKHDAQHPKSKSHKKEESNLIKNAESEINDVFIINKLFKGVDLNSYPYNRTTAKKIKFIFKAFLDNLIEHELLMKSIKNESKNPSSPSTQMKKEPNPIETAKNKLYYGRYRQRVLSQLENELAQQKQEAINTTIETQSNIVTTIHSPRRRNLKMEDAYDYQRKKREMELKKLRIEKEESEMKNCTFRPNSAQLGKRPTNHFNSKSLVDKLYKEGLEKIKEKRELIKKLEEEKAQKELDPSILTFKPKINPLDETVFFPRHIEAYEISKKNVGRFEKARIERKIAEIQKQTGITNLTQINNIDSLLKENAYPAWNFTIEKRKFKDTFNNTSRFSKIRGQRKNPNNTNYSSIFNMHDKTKSSVNNNNTTGNNEQTLYLDINLNDNSPSKRLKLNLQADPKVIVEDFANKYELPEDEKINLIALIEEKVNETKLLNIKDSENYITEKLKT